jgi:hypothetical protein
VSTIMRIGVSLSSTHIMDSVGIPTIGTARHRPQESIPSRKGEEDCLLGEDRLSRTRRRRGRNRYYAS